MDASSLFPCGCDAAPWEGSLPGRHTERRAGAIDGRSPPSCGLLYPAIRSLPRLRVAGLRVADFKAATRPLCAEIRPAPPISVRLPISVRFIRRVRSPQAPPWVPKLFSAQRFPSRRRAFPAPGRAPGRKNRRGPECSPPIASSPPLPSPPPISPCLPSGPAGSPPLCPAPPKPHLVPCRGPRRPRLAPPDCRTRPRAGSLSESRSLPGEAPLHPSRIRVDSRAFPESGLGRRDQAWPGRAESRSRDSRRG